jgi:glucuronate isomerase
LYHWAHLELKRYFGVDALLNEESAPAIWQLTNDRLQDDDLSARGILERFHVTAVCTTDDPTDSLQYHRQLRESGMAARVFPTFRPDRALRTADPASFNQWVDQLSRSSNVEIARLVDFLAALRQRHDAFHQHGCRLSDHGLDHCYAESCTEAEASAAFGRVRSGQALSQEEADKFASYLMIFFGHLDAEKGWTKQLHLGAYRNANGRMLNGHGRDMGFDSIGDWPQVQSLGRYLDSLDRAGSLPRTIIYNANPADNYAFAAMAGNFQDGGSAAKMQLGSAWWFLDQKDAMEMQLNALSNCGLLARFVGMVTDSRSFMSYPRHEYFRRVLCNLLGNEVEKGELPDDEDLVGNMIRRICYQNAVDYLGLPSHKKAEAAAASNGHGMTRVEGFRQAQIEKES